MRLSLSQIGQALLGTCLTVALYFSGVFIFWAPLPLFYFSLHDRKPAWILTFALLSLASAFLFWQTPFLQAGLFAFYLLTALFLSLGVWKRRALVAWSFQGGFFITALLLGSGFVIQKSGLIDLATLINATLIQTAALFDKIAAEPELVKHHQEALLLTTQMKVWLFYLPKLIPSLLFVSVVGILLLNAGMFKSLTKKKQNKVKGIWNFAGFQPPFFWVWGLIGSGFLFFLNAYWLALSPLKIVALNLLIIALFVYFIQGLSVLAFVTKRFSPLFRFSIYGLLVLFLQLLGTVIVGLGLTDVWFDFRKINKSGGSYDGSHPKGRNQSPR